MIKKYYDKYYVKVSVLSVLSRNIKIIYNIISFYNFKNKVLKLQSLLYFKKSNLYVKGKKFEYSKNNVKKIILKTNITYKNIVLL